MFLRTITIKGIIPYISINPILKTERPDKKMRKTSADLMNFRKNMTILLPILKRLSKNALLKRKLPEKLLFPLSLMPQ